MFNYLEKLRQKPEKAKKKFAFLTALSFAGIIFVVWLSVVYPNLGKQKEKDDRVKSLEPSPLSSFFETVSLGASEIGSNISEIKNITKTFNFMTEVATSTIKATSSTEKIESKPIQIINVSEISSSTATTSTKNTE